jgi:hypothetical protein
MGEKTIVLYLRMKGMRLDAVDEDLVRTLWKEAVAYSNVTKYVRNAPLAPKSEALRPGPADCGHGPVDEVILAAIREYPFFSVRELCRLTCPPRSTVHRHMAKSLRFTVHDLRCVPHFLTAAEKRIRVDMAGEQLRGLSSQMTHQWHDIVKLDEPWVYPRDVTHGFAVWPGQTHLSIHCKVHHFSLFSRIGAQ